MIEIDTLLMILDLAVFVIAVFWMSRDLLIKEFDKKIRWTWLIFLLIGSVIFRLPGTIVVVVVYIMWRNRNLPE